MNTRLGVIGKNTMYRLMKSEKIVLDHMVSGPMVSYRQEEIERFQKFSIAIAACEIANLRSDARHYILDEAGKEFYAGTWIA